MKIQDIRLLPLRGETPDGGWDEKFLDRENNLHTLVEVITDERVTGVGSVFTSAKLIEGAIDVIRPFLIGASALDPTAMTERFHQQTFWQGRGGAITHAISGIDIALWDILGKVTKQPISRLLGGRFRDRIKPYGSLLMDEPDRMRGPLEEGLARGFRAFKIGWGPFGRRDRKTDEAIVKAAREVIGPDVELMVDAGGSDAFWPHGYKWALQTATMLVDYDVVWFEEALRPDDLEGYIKLTENAPLPIASCEVLTRRQSFLPWIERRAVDYIQPDVTKVGGISEEFRIAQYADDHSILFVPHGWNTAVGLAADLQLLAAVPCARWVEYITPAPYIERLLAKPIELDEEGMIEIPSTPGLGFDWDLDGIEEFTGGLRLTESV
ncbi:mandelate racemase/muconate lactonizing enzyme family protein [Verrucomicrobia bacterium]|jgi:D-galactarolactone cycloisomerase|nr:mandelate racemase/muconate lactonizing enzyme family protein [Verrucomicrobiota bacterium]